MHFNLKNNLNLFGIFPANHSNYTVESAFFMTKIPALGSEAVAPDRCYRDGTTSIAPDPTKGRETPKELLKEEIPNQAKTD